MQNKECRGKRDLWGWRMWKTNSNEHIHRRMNENTVEYDNNNDINDVDVVHDDDGQQDGADNSDDGQLNADIFDK